MLPSVQEQFILGNVVECDKKKNREAISKINFTFSHFYFFALFLVSHFYFLLHWFNLTFLISLLRGNVLTIRHKSIQCSKSLIKCVCICRVAKEGLYCIKQLSNRWTTEMTRTFPFCLLFSFNNQYFASIHLNIWLHKPNI